jgi:probable rRNA maturation factor
VKLRLELSENSPRNLPLDLEILSREIESALSPILGDINASAAVTCVSDDVIKELNLRYRLVGEPTDVLSFPLWEERGRFVPPRGWDLIPLGDVVVSPDFVRRNAENENIGYNNEMVRMIVHGALHLVGFDHDAGERGEEMRALQERIVAGYEQHADESGED